MLADFQRIISAEFECPYDLLEFLLPIVVTVTEHWPSVHLPGGSRDMLWQFVHHPLERRDSQISVPSKCIGERFRLDSAIFVPTIVWEQFFIALD